MSEPNEKPAIAGAPISVLLFAHALSTETADALTGWRQYLDGLRREYEIFLVQETRPELAPSEDPAEGPKPTRLFTYERAIGFRDALNDAISAAQYPLIVFCPADRQYRPSDLAGMLGVIDKVDLVAGFRTGGQAPPWRVMLDTLLGLLSRVLIGVPLEPRACWLGSEGWGRRWLARSIFGVHTSDPECPFRLARREIFARLPLQSGGSFVQVEMLAKANFLSCYFAEEPVAWTPPVEVHEDGIPFGHDARLVFRNPEFSTSQNHLDS